MLKNFIRTLVRFKTAALLNLLGLAAAYVVFLIIILQVTTEYSFDTMYPDSDRIYRVEKESSWDKGMWGPNMLRPHIEEIASTSPDIEQWAVSDVFPPVASYRFESELNSNPLFRTSICLASGSFMDLFDMKIIQGKFDQIDPNVVMIPRSMAEKYCKEGSPVGRTIVLEDGYSGVGGNGRFTVSGVYEDFPQNSSIRNAIYMNLGDRLSGNWSDSNLAFYVKLRKGASAERVADFISDNSAYENKETGSRIDRSTFRLTPIEELYFSADSLYKSTKQSSRQTTDLFLFIALLVLVIASINYINFSTALVPLRIKGINTRKVYGASNGLLRGGMLFEAIGLSMMAYAVAVAIVLGLRNLDSISFVDMQIVILEHWPILLYGALIALVVGFTAGIYPALYSTKFKMAYVLKGSFGLSPKGRALRSSLLGFQYVVSIGLIIASIFMNIQYGMLSSKNMGFERENILSVSMSSNLAKSRSTFVSELQSRADIVDATASSGKFFNDEYSAWGRPYRDSTIQFEHLTVENDFLRFFGMKVIEGSDFTQNDELPGGGGAIIFNRTAQKKFGLVVGDSVSNMPIVGIVEDFNYKPLYSQVEPFALLCFAFGGSSSSALYLKCISSDYPALIDYIKATGRNLDPDWEPNVSFMDSRIEELYQKEARAVSQISFFSLMAIIISMLGVFGLVFFETGYRRKEIALRKINGATISMILSMFNRRFVLIVVVCFVIAAPLAWWGVDAWLKSFAYRTPIYWWVFALAFAIVLLITVLTITVQSLRAARENPVNSLKSE